ncbi:MAG: hypothetical protein ABI551_26220 [Polyangiaceae bacterium]
MAPNLERLAKVLPSCLLYDFAEDHGFNLLALVDGNARARLTAANEVGPRSTFVSKPWIDDKWLSKPDATTLGDFLEHGKWTNAEARDRVAEAVGFPVFGWLSWETIERDGGVESLSVFQKYPTAIRFANGEQSQLVDPLLSADRGVEAILQREHAQPKKKSESTRPLRLNAAEAKSIAEAFRDAAPLVASPRDLVAFVDLASCVNARAWLDAKKKVDPATATDEVIEQLRIVVDEGRYPDEGDRAIVVREAAGMLLAKCLKQRKVDVTKWIKGARKTKTAGAKAAWELVESLAKPKT